MLYFSLWNGAVALLQTLEVYNSDQFLHGKSLNPDGNSIMYTIANSCIFMNEETKVQGG